MNSKVEKAYTEALAAVHKFSEEREALLQENGALKAYIEGLNEQQEKATEQDDFDLYSNVAKAKTEAEFQLAVNEKRLKAFSKAPSISDYKGTWEAFSAIYEKEFKPLYAEYIKKRHELYERFTVLVDMQGKAGALRNAIADVCGMTEPYLIDTDATSYASIGMFTSIPSKPVRFAQLRHAPDSAYFIATGESPAEEDNHLFNVINCKK